MHINKRILAGLIVLMPLVFWTALFEGYTLPKWFLWRWGAVCIFLSEIIIFAQNDSKKKKEKALKVFLPSFVFPWLAFFFFSLLSLGGAVNLQSGLLNAANLVLGLSLFLFISGRWEEFEIKALIPFLILPALPVAVYGICQAFGFDFISLSGPFRGAISTFGHRNFVAEYELMILPLLLYGGFFGFDKSNPYRFMRIFSFVSLPFVYTHFIMTHTRGSYVALIVTLLFMVGFYLSPHLHPLPKGCKSASGGERHGEGSKVRRWFVGTAALLLLLTGLFLARNYNLPGEKVIGEKNGILRLSPQNNIFPPTLPPPSPDSTGRGPASRGRSEGVAQDDTVVNALRDDTFEIPSSLQSRILIWQATLAAFRNHPVAGVGSGNLNEVIPSYYPEKLRDILKGKLEAGTSHNEYLQILAETGILGGVSFLAFLLLLLSFAGKVSWRAAKEKNEFLPFFLMASILGILTASLVSSPLQKPVTFFLFWLFIGFLTVFGREKSPSFILSRKVQERILVGFLVVLVISAYNFGWQAVCADFYGKRSSNAYRVGNRQQAVLDIEKALTFQPQNRNLLTLSGNAYLGAGRLKEAINSYSRVIVYHPYWPQGYGNLGLVLAQAGFFAEAEKYLKYSLRLDGYQPLVRNTLGVVYLQQGKRAEAKEEFLKALALEPALALPKLNLQEMEKKTVTPTSPPPSSPEASAPLAQRGRNQIK